VKLFTSAAVAVCCLVFTATSAMSMGAVPAWGVPELPEANIPVTPSTEGPFDAFLGQGGFANAGPGVSAFAGASGFGFIPNLSVPTWGFTPQPSIPSGLLISPSQVEDGSSRPIDHEWLY